MRAQETDPERPEQRFIKVPLADDEEAFKGAAPLLFGESFERRMKDHLESLKCLRRSMAPKPGTDQFFRKGRSLYPARGGGNFRGRGGGQRYNQEAETDTSRRRTISAVSGLYMKKVKSSIST